jgi:hypothetical protein
MIFDPSISARARSRQRTEATSPYIDLLVSSTASSAESTGWTITTGPKVSSHETPASSGTSARIVGS